MPYYGGGFSDDGFWRVVKHFNYTLLRKSFQTALLNEMEKHIGPSFKKTKALIYKKDSNGFYVYAKPNLSNTQTVKNMSDSDLLDMHYFLTDDDDWNGDEPEEGFYIDLFQ